MKLMIALLLTLITNCWCGCDLKTKFNAIHESENDSAPQLIHNNIDLTTYTKSNRPKLTLDGGRLGVLCEQFAKHFNDKTTLTFADFGITTLEKRAFYDDVFDKLEHLEIVHNRIDSMPMNVFRSKTLTVLSLRDNDIEVIDEDAFKDLPALKTLVLSQNKLQHVVAEWFKYSASLRFVVLNHNRIETLHAGDFSELASGVTCTSSGAQINHDDCPVILLSNNRLKEADRDAFKGLKHIAVLGMEYNDFESLPIFDDVAISICSFQYNEIKHVDESVLQQYGTRLNYTFLYGNALTHAATRNIEWYNRVYHERMFYKIHSMSIAAKTIEKIVI